MGSSEGFTALQKRLRESWFGLVETSDAWTDLGKVGDGESQSRRVRNNIDRMEAVAKPGPEKATETCCRAAHEKIAFDLSCVVSLPVPAVVLWPDGLGAEYVRGRAISSRAFAQAEKWNIADSKRLLSLLDKAQVSAEISAMRIFHAWIGDTDRKQDHVIFDLDSPKGYPRIAFIDHGFSMSYAWKTPSVPLAPIRNYVADVPEDTAMMRQAADFIREIPDADVERIVMRVPEAYLPDPEREHILKNLLARKRNLHTLVGA